MTDYVLLNHLRNTSQAAKNFVNNIIGNIAGTVADCLLDLAKKKADKITVSSFSIPASGWVADSSVVGYAVHLDIPVTGITNTDVATITLAPSSVRISKECGLCPTNETISGKIRLWAMKAPTSTMSSELIIQKQYTG